MNNPDNLSLGSIPVVVVVIVILWDKYFVFECIFVCSFANRINVHLTNCCWFIVCWFNLVKLLSFVFSSIFLWTKPKSGTNAYKIEFVHSLHDIAELYGQYCNAINTNKIIQGKNLNLNSKQPKLCTYIGPIHDFSTSPEFHRSWKEEEKQMTGPRMESLKPLDRYAHTKSRASTVHISLEDSRSQKFVSIHTIWSHFRSIQNIRTI